MNADVACGCVWRLVCQTLWYNLLLCFRLAAELENDASLGTPSAEEVQTAAKLEADSSQDLQEKMQALQSQVDAALTELRSRSPQTTKDRRPVSQLKVCLQALHVKCVKQFYATRCAHS